MRLKPYKALTDENWVDIVALGQEFECIRTKRLCFTTERNYGKGVIWWPASNLLMMNKREILGKSSSFYPELK